MKQSLKALVIEDEPQLRALVGSVLRDDGWIISEVGTAAEAVTLLDTQTWSLVFCDVVLGGPDGYSVLEQFTERQPSARFIMMTGQGSAAGAFDATSTGAYDYLLKPFSIDDILKISSDIKEQLKSRTRRDKSGKPAKPGYKASIPLVGTAPKFVECLKLVGRVAVTNLPVLITRAPVSFKTPTPR